MNRYAYCIFCDDIRQEIGYKMSLMGVYLSELHVAVVPAFLPKLCIAAFCNTEIENPLHSLIIRVTSDGKVLQESIIQNADLEKMQSDIVATAAIDEPLQRILIGAQLVVTPFVIEKATTIQVTIIADEVEMIAGKLRIKHIPDQTS